MSRTHFNVLELIESVDSPSVEFFDRKSNNGSVGKQQKLSISRRSRSRAGSPTSGSPGDQHIIIPAVKTHHLVKRQSGKSPVYGNQSTAGGNESWESFKIKAEDILLGAAQDNEDSTIFDLTEVNSGPGSSNNNLDGGSRLRPRPDSEGEQDEENDALLEDLLRPPKPLGPLSRQAKNSKKPHSKLELPPSAAELAMRSVKIGRAGGLQAQIMEMDVMKFIVMRESLVCRLKAVTASLRQSARQLMMSRVRAEEPLKSDLVDKVRTNQILFRQLLGDLRKGSIAVVETVCEWRRAVADEEMGNEKSEYSTVTFTWQGMNYLQKMKRDTSFLKKKVSRRNSAVYAGMSAKERVVQLLSDDDRDVIGLWLGLKEGQRLSKNPLFIANEEGFPDVVKVLSIEKENWEVTLAQAKHDESEELAREYMKKRFANQSSANRGVLSAVDGNDAPENETLEWSIGDGGIVNRHQLTSAETTASGLSVQDSSVFEGEESVLSEEHIRVREPWRWFALDLAPTDRSLLPEVEEAIVQRARSAHDVLMLEDEVEQFLENQRRERLEQDDTYDAITSIAEGGGVVAILDDMLEVPPAGNEADLRLRNRQQGRNLRSLPTGTMTMPQDPENIDDLGSLQIPAVRPNRSKMVERLNELLEDEGVLHTGYVAQGGNSMFGSSLQRRPGATESKRYERNLNRSAKKIQARVRGMLSRLPGHRVDMLKQKRLALRNVSATQIQRIARGMLDRLYVEEYRLTHSRNMTEEEAAVLVQAGLRAMWARRYVDVIRSYETLKREGKLTQTYQSPVSSPEKEKHVEEDEDEERMEETRKGYGTFVTNLDTAIEEEEEYDEYAVEQQDQGGLGDTEDSIVFEGDASSEWEGGESVFVSRKRAEVLEARDEHIVHEGLLNEDV